MGIQSLWIFAVSIVALNGFAQGSFFGGFQANSNFYIRDSTIGAAGIPHYDDLKNSTDAWLNLDYTNNRFGLDIGVRFDVYAHSNLHNPGGQPVTAVGLGRYYIRKRFEKVRITGGTFYDQFGSGIVFRAFEDRTLGIDNAILGAHVMAEPIKQLRIKAFAGVQKERLGPGKSIFDYYNPILIGANIESNISIKDKVQFLPGVSFLNRTMDKASIEAVVANIELLDTSQRFVPKYNVYVFGGYNTLNVGNLGWYIEAAGKTQEAIRGEDDKLENKYGYVIYSTLNYFIKNFGFALQFKRTENFTLRTSPNETLLAGVLNFVPPVTRQNALRLPARYNAVVQELEELAYSGDVNYSPIPRKLTINLHFAESRDFDKELKFRETFGNVELKLKRKWKGMLGFQFIQYDQEFYEGEVYGNYRLVNAYTPFGDFTYKFNRKHSLQFKLQYQYTQQDFGSWIFALVEYNIAPWLSVAVSDMYNYDPNPERINEKVHYYQVFTSFTYKSHVLTLGYSKQVAGIVCTGGVCRYEPAFNGIKLTLNSTF